MSEDEEMKEPVNSNDIHLDEHEEHEKHETDNIFKVIKRKIRDCKIYQSVKRDKYSKKAQSIFSLLSKRSQKFFERKLKRFSEQTITGFDDIEDLK